MVAFWVFLIILVVVIGFVIAIYNGLIRLKNQVANGFAQIEVQLKRRHDLIPNLVSVANRYLAHEESVLVAVTEARNLARQASANLDGVDDVTLQKIAQAESGLSKALANFYGVVENYPELKADSMLSDLSDELKNTENRIGFARQFYNDSVMFYNNHRESFPNNIIANFFNFKRINQLEFDDHSSIISVPTVNL